MVDHRQKFKKALRSVQSYLKVITLGCSNLEAVGSDVKTAGS